MIMISVCGVIAFACMSFPNMHATEVLGNAVFNHRDLINREGKYLCFNKQR